MKRRLLFALPIIVVMLALVASVARGQVVSQTPIVQVFGHTFAVYDLHLFNDRYKTYLNRTQNEYTAAQLADAEARRDMEARYDQAQKLIRDANPEFYDAMMRQYGLEFAPDRK